MPIKGSKKCPKCGKYSIPPCLCEKTNTTDMSLESNTNYAVKLDINMDGSADYKIVEEDSNTTWIGTSKVTLEKDESKMEFEVDENKIIRSVKVTDPNMPNFYTEPKKEKWWKRLFKRGKKNVS